MVTAGGGGGAGRSSLVVAWASVIVGGVVSMLSDVEIIRVVVVEVETLRRITLRFLNFGDAYHEDFIAKILSLLVLFA